MFGQKRRNDGDSNSRITDVQFTSAENSCQINVDNSTNVLKIMKTLYTDHLMNDVYLKVGNKEYPAHRLILCASSDVFQAMLMKPEWSEWHESRVELQELPECEIVFDVFLQYFYTGKIVITHTNVLAILALADKYIVKSLISLCVNYMSEHIAHAAAHNQLFLWLQYTMTCGHKEVCERCQNYIKWNFQSVANTPDFSNFEVEVLCGLLQQNDLVVFNEMVLYNCVVRWLDLQLVRLRQSNLPNHELNSQMRHLVEMVMGYIRFPMMSPRDLAGLLLSPLVKEYKEFFVERMATGMAYHSGQRDSMELLSCTEEGRLLLTPRLYTSDNYSNVLLIENIHNLPSYHTSTFVFSAHTSTADYELDKMNEWMVDLYPKGIWFKKCSLIVWQGTLEVPEEIIKTVRLSLTCRDTDLVGNLRVRIGILLYGSNGGTEHVMQVIVKRHQFNSQDRIMNFDKLIPFEELNPAAVSLEARDSPYLVGPHRDKLKINVVISPLTPFCSVAEPTFVFDTGSSSDLLE